ncbi:hypothetical protein B0H21DRAFT_724308 [Amylocystis lapponica]|nr:hypothetical protein B0H21DRAFT_724308 [Amylocystis lapponica]
MCIFGAVLVEVFIVQPFMEYIYLCGDPFSTERIMHVAKVFGAVAKAARSLSSDYRQLSLNGTAPILSRLFPMSSYLEDRPPRGSNTKGVKAPTTGAPFSAPHTTACPSSSSPARCTTRRHTSCPPGSSSRPSCTSAHWFVAISSW